MFFILDKRNLNRTNWIWLWKKIYWNIRNDLSFITMLIWNDSHFNFQIYNIIIILILIWVKSLNLRSLGVVKFILTIVLQILKFKPTFLNLYYNYNIKLKFFFTFYWLLKTSTRQLLSPHKFTYHYYFLNYFFFLFSTR